MDPKTRQDASRLREPGPGGTRAAAWIGGLAAAFVVVAGAAGVLLALAPPSYRAEAQVLVGARSFGLVGLRAHVASPDREASARALTKGQAQLVASRDLARRAIEDLRIDARPEFDASAEGLSPASHLLVLLGLKRDPSRMSRPERVLQAYEDRLSVSTEPRSRLITIAFESQDRDLAAKAANRIADLYLEMRAETKERALGVPEARIVSRAVSPHRPVFPQTAWGLALGLSASFATAVGTLVASQRLRACRRDPSDESIMQPLPLGRARMLPRLHDNGPVIPAPTTAGMTSANAAEGTQAVGAVAQRILSARRGVPGTVVLVTSCTEASETVRVTLDLARRLGEEARAILIGLDKRQRLDVLLAPAPDRSARVRDPQPGVVRLTDLARGLVSFAEVIRRDPGSRLHYVAADSDGRIDLAGSEPVFEALAETYDFVVLAAPPLDRADSALTLAEAVDFVVLATPPQGGEIAWRNAEAALMERGAREVRIVGASSRLRRSVASSLGRDAA